MIIQNAVFISMSIVFYLIIKLVFKVEINRKWVYLYKLVIFQGIAWMCIHKNILPVLIIPIVIFAGYWFMLNVGVIDRIKILMILAAVFIFLEEFVNIILDMFSIYIVFDNGISDAMQYVQNYCTIIFILILLNVIKDKEKLTKSKNDNSRINQILIYVMLVFLEISMIATITFVRYIAYRVSDKRLEEVFDIIAFASFLGIGIVLILIIKMINVNKRIIEVLEQEVLLKSTQEAYYETLLKKEEETRKFRHEIKRHLMCIQELAVECEDTQVMDYIGNLNTEIEHISNKIYVSGNKIVDILMNYYIDMLRENISVNIRGYLKNDINISHTDMCIIFGNLLKNAVQELNQGDMGGYLNINFAEGKQYKRIEMENSIVKDKKEILKYSNKDKKYHGYGLKNLREAVIRNNGKLTQTCNDDFFRISILFNIYE